MFFPMQHSCVTLLQLWFGEPVKSSCNEKEITSDTFREAHKSATWDLEVSNLMLTISNIVMLILSLATVSPKIFVYFQYFIFKSKLSAWTSGYIGKQQDIIHFNFNTSQRDSLSNQAKAWLERRDKFLSREYIKNRWNWEIEYKYKSYIWYLCCL
jgi:hypothetical protein